MEATYIAYGFNYLKLGTKSEDFSFIGEIINGRKWVEDKEGLVTRPVVKESEAFDSPLLDIKRGSTYQLINLRRYILAWLMNMKWKLMDFLGIQHRFGMNLVLVWRS